MSSMLLVLPNKSTWWCWTNRNVRLFVVIALVNVFSFSTFFSGAHNILLEKRNVRLEKKKCNARESTRTIGEKCKLILSHHQQSPLINERRAIDSQNIRDLRGGREFTFVCCASRIFVVLWRIFSFSTEPTGDTRTWVTCVGALLIVPLSAD